ncbi:hypothetical protein ACLF6K_36150 [Streptomyces xanthophaeus]|uniref:hypothetical protein n=1 Tax=Streptomyces xanthophaeus TaxID=67385 RepID=UPI0039901D58
MTVQLAKSSVHNRSEDLPVDLETIRQSVALAEAVGLLAPRAEIDELALHIRAHLALLLAEDLGDEFQIRDVYRRGYALLEQARQVTESTPNFVAWEHMQRMASITESCSRLWVTCHQHEDTV